MYTYASQELTGSELAMWRLEMAPGAAGPVHSVDTEQVLVMLEGEIELVLEGEVRVLASGASAVLPAGHERQLRNESQRPAAAMVAARAGARATAPGKENVAIPWAA
jgi:quercetin dioxygenase-like cupin family protein